MKSLHQLMLIGISILCFGACNSDEFGDRKESMPIIESASLTPTIFNFGDSVTLSINISDPKTQLTSLLFEVLANNQVLTSETLPLSGSTSKIAHQFIIPLLSNQADNAPISVKVTAINVLNGTASSTITGLTGKRSVFPQLYLLTDDGALVTLNLLDDKISYKATGVTLSNTINYRIAERITPNQQIDYKGTVWGNKKGKLSVINSTEEASFAYVSNAVYIESVLFNSMNFDIKFQGTNTLAPNDISLSNFTENAIDGEDCKKQTLQLKKGQEYTLIGVLASTQVVCNLDFFERTANNKVKFLGETDDYTIYYNAYRKNLMLTPSNPSHPNYLLLTGTGLGYPTKVEGIIKSHTSWGFGNVMQYILFRKIADNVFQGTLYLNQGADFKPFENDGWANQKSFSDFTSITGEQILQGSDNWEVNDNNLDPKAFYQITINLNTANINVKKTTL